MTIPFYNFTRSMLSVADKRHDIGLIAIRRALCVFDYLIIIFFLYIFLDLIDLKYFLSVI